MKLKIDRVRYHRNGSMGAGFHLLEFRWRMKGERRERRFVGVTFDEPGNCAVFEPSNPLNRWRGDEFESVLRVAVEAAAMDPATFDRTGSDN